LYIGSGLVLFSRHELLVVVVVVVVLLLLLLLLLTDGQQIAPLVFLAVSRYCHSLLYFLALCCVLLFSLSVSPSLSFSFSLVFFLPRSVVCSPSLLYQAAGHPGEDQRLSSRVQCC
jgi:hypothetical protein